jgi:hypothetical protein
MFTSLLAGDCHTTNSHFSNCRLKTLVIAAAPRCLGTDRKENAPPNSFSIVASRNFCTTGVDNTASQLLHCCLLRICCLTTGLCTTISYRTSFTEVHPRVGRTSALYWVVQLLYQRPVLLAKFFEVYPNHLSKCRYNTSN